MERPNIELFLQNATNEDFSIPGAKWIAGYSLAIEAENTNWRAQNKRLKAELKELRRLVGEYREADSTTNEMKARAALFEYYDSRKPDTTQ